jgi:hypothetical protein
LAQPLKPKTSRIGHKNKVLSSDCIFILRLCQKVVKNKKSGFQGVLKQLKQLFTKCLMRKLLYFKSFKTV